MSRLEEIKKQYAAECNYNSWTDLVKAEGTDHDYDQISIRYAKECSQASLEKVSNELSIALAISDYDYSIDELITDESNIVLL